MSPLAACSSGSCTNDINFSIFAASDSTVLFFSWREGGREGGREGEREEGRREVGREGREGGRGNSIAYAHVHVHVYVHIVCIFCVYNVYAHESS